MATVLIKMSFSMFNKLKELYVFILAAVSHINIVRPHHRSRKKFLLEASNVKLIE